MEDNIINNIRYIQDPNIKLTDEQLKIRNKLFETAINKAFEEDKNYMKTADEIFEDVLKYNDIPKYHNVLEINCFMSLRILLKQFNNNHISKELATKEKMKIFRVYNGNKKEFEFKESIHDEYIENIKKTSELRILLRHQLNDHDKYSLNTALKIISLYSKERWDICGDKTS